MKTCNIDGCEKKSTRKKMCVMHYARLRRYGDVGSPEQRGIKITDEQIKEMRESYNGKYGEQQILARKYGLHCAYISTLVNNKVRVA